MNVLTQQIIIEAHKHIGVKESAHNSGPEIDKWLARVHCAPGAPWCAAFAWCMLDDACAALGMPNPLFPTAGVFTLIGRARVARAWSAEPGPGFIFAIDHGIGPDGQHLGHCGIVCEVEAMHLVTIEGNTNEAGSREGNAVVLKTRRIEEPTLGYLDPGLLLVGQVCSEAAPGDG